MGDTAVAITGSNLPNTTSMSVAFTQDGVTQTVSATYISSTRLLALTPQFNDQNSADVVVNVLPNGRDAINETLSFLLYGMYLLFSTTT